MRRNDRRLCIICNDCARGGPTIFDKYEYSTPKRTRTRISTGMFEALSSHACEHSGRADGVSRRFNASKLQIADDRDDEGSTGGRRRKLKRHLNVRRRKGVGRPLAIGGIT